MSTSISKVEKEIMRRIYNSYDLIKWYANHNPRLPIQQMWDECSDSSYMIELICKINVDEADELVEMGIKAGLTRCVYRGKWPGYGVVYLAYPDKEIDFCNLIRTRIPNVFVFAEQFVK